MVILQQKKSELTTSVNNMESNLNFRKITKNTASKITASKVVVGILKHPILTIKVLADLSSQKARTAANFDQAKTECSTSINDLMNEVEKTNSVLKKAIKSYAIQNKEQAVVDNKVENMDNLHIMTGNINSEPDDEFIPPQFHNEAIIELKEDELDELDALGSYYESTFNNLDHTPPLNDIFPVTSKNAVLTESDTRDNNEEPQNNMSDPPRFRA